MFFDVFSQVFEGNAIFIENEKPYNFYIDSGRFKWCYFIGFSYVQGNTRFSADAFSMNSFEDFNGKIVCLGRAQELKESKSLCESDNCCFLGFFDSLEFREQ